jgi:hypothetical protein
VSDIVALLERPGSRVKYPKLLVTVNGQDIRLTVATERSNAPGSINVTSAEGDREGRTWYGRIFRDGRFMPAKNLLGSTSTAIIKALHELAADPAGVAAAYGHRTGNCCFCSLPLTDARSLEVGYGQKCAKNYNLPWGPKAVAKAKAEAEAKKVTAAVETKPIDQFAFAGK